MTPDVWIAAQVRTNREFSVSTILRGKGYETFVPVYVTLRKWSDRQVTREVPLISGYVFLRTVLSRTQAPVVSTPGVVKMVGFGGGVTSIEEKEIDVVRTIANSPLKKEPWSYLKQNAQVQIAHGALKGVVGTLLEIKKGTLLIVSIEMLQRSVAVEIDRSWLASPDSK